MQKAVFKTLVIIPDNISIRLNHVTNSYHSHSARRTISTLKTEVGLKRNLETQKEISRVYGQRHFPIPIKPENISWIILGMFQKLII